VVRTNDPDAASVVLELRANIVSAIEVTPNDTPLIRGAVDDLKPAVVTVSAADGRAFDVVKVDAPPTVRVEIGPAPGAPAVKTKKKGAVASGAKSYAVVITPTSATPIGSSTATVVVATNHPKAHSVPIRTRLIVAGRVAVDPPQLFMAPGTGGAPLHVRISKRSGSPLEIGEVTSTDRDFRASATPVSQGREYDLAVSYVGAPGRGAVNARIMVKTNEPGQDVLVVPVAGRF
jgi:hypothetical protein